MIICKDCRGIHFVPQTNDVVVIEYSQFGPSKIWNADRLECLGCHKTIIAGFGMSPIWKHDRGPLPEHIINDAMDNGRLDYLFENNVQRDHFMALDIPDRHRRYPFAVNVNGDLAMRQTKTATEAVSTLAGI